MTVATGIHMKKEVVIPTENRPTIRITRVAAIKAKVARKPVAPVMGMIMEVLAQTAVTTTVVAVVLRNPITGTRTRMAVTPRPVATVGVVLGTWNR